MLVVAGTLAFTISFVRSEGSQLATEKDKSSVAARKKSSFSKVSSGGNAQSLRVTQRNSRPADPARYDIKLSPESVSRLSDSQVLQVTGIVSRARENSRKKLEKLTSQYNLSNSQRKNIFPLIVAYQPEAHPAMVAGGSYLPSIASGSTLEESIYPYLDEEQKDALTEATLDHNAWWKDIVGQLEDDLDQAIDTGEMIAVEVTDTEADDMAGISVSDGPAASHGEASSHSGGNLFDLLGQ